MEVLVVGRVVGAAASFDGGVSTPVDDLIMAALVGLLALRLKVSRWGW